MASIKNINRCYYLVSLEIAIQAFRELEQQNEWWCGSYLCSGDWKQIQMFVLTTIQENYEYILMFPVIKKTLFNSSDETNCYLFLMTYFYLHMSSVSLEMLIQFA